MARPALPDFPWDSLAEPKATASAHKDGIVNLSVGTPVDPVAPGIQLALAQAADSHDYPMTAGTEELRTAMVAALQRRYDIPAQAVLPVIGTKEAIAWLPTLLGAEHVVYPELAYPTYEVAARLAKAECMAADSLTQIGPAKPDLLFINSPSNPTGKVLGLEHLRKVVSWAQERGVVVASDECYLGLGWEDDNPPISILDPRVCGDDHTNLIAIHSLSKTSNLAGYRAGFFAGDPQLISELLEARKHAGMIVPGPIQAAMVAALSDDDHELEQKRRYAHRRAVLLRALVEAGFSVDESAAGLYLWATRGESCRETVDWLARRGILVAPGDFYGVKGTEHVRVSLTETDERIEAAAARLRAEN